MEWLYILLGVIGGLLLIVLITSFICFYRVFYSPKRRVLGEDEYEIPDGKEYLEFSDTIKGWVRMTREMRSELMEIKSDDGLTLRGRYYECQAGAPVELLFHGYRGNAERDLSGGVERCFSLGRNALIINQRASGDSEGHVITFGIKESKDCVRWAQFAAKRFGENCPIILTGISMGAATVTMAAGEELPANVVCVLSDCGYSSPKEIIKKVIREMKLPADLLYPFVRLGGIIFGRFDVDSNSSVEALKKAKIPVIFIHGDADAFIPADMSRKQYDACASEKELVLISGAGHGLSFPVDKDKYLSALKDFEAVWKK